MQYRTFHAYIGAAVFLISGAAGCSAGGSATSPAVSSAGAQTLRPALTATGTVTVVIPPAAHATGAIRKPAYVSGATGHAALFINGSNTAAGSTTTCSSSSCTISWTAALAVPASYTFAVEIDTGAAGSPANTVLAENASTYVIHAGANTLAPLTLNGVAGSAKISGESCAGSSCSGTLTIEDAAGDAITFPGSGFDNAAVTVSSSNSGNGKVTTPSAPLTAVSSNGQYTYDFTCVNATGTFTINATSGSGSGAVTAAELSGLSPAVSYPASTLTITQNSSTYICRAGTTIAKVFFLSSPVTALSTFSVPSDWNNADNSIEVIGGGGGGGGGANYYGGGGGGAYAMVSNQTLAGTVDYEIGKGGAGGTSANGTAGGSSWFCRATTACGSAGGGKVIVAATGGGQGKSNTGGAGGTVKAGTGNAGGAAGPTAVTTSTGGGGAGGPLGAGGAGGAQGTSATVSPGGGGNGGGSAGQGGTGVGSPAGQGGNNEAGTGAGSEPGGGGTNGGGGGGGSSSTGGSGGNGTEWSALFGGGGGGGASDSSAAGAGGLYGGGGGGSLTNGGAGGSGLIVVIYTP